MASTGRNWDSDRAAGVLVGQAAGDALGAGYEFAGKVPAVPKMVGGGLGNWKPGEWTDDTQQALCIAQEAATGVLSVQGVGERLLAWYRGGPADVGNQTSAVLAHAASAGDLTATAADRFARHPTGSAGNGSLMRTGPVALAHLGDDAAIAEAATAISALTHGDPVCGEACVLWCIAIDRALRESRLDGIRDGLTLLPEASRQRWATWIDEAETRPPSSFNPNGYVVSAFQAALAAITQTPVPTDRPGLHLRQALAAAVRIGHDTDTVAAIAGALLGARWGASAVPPGWFHLMQGWPGLWATDLVRLGILSAWQGKPDKVGWPAADDLTDYYEREWANPPYAVALEDDPGVTLGNVFGLDTPAGRNADIVVSACRLGAGQVAPSRAVTIQMLDSTDPEQNKNLDLVIADVAEAIEQWRSDGKTVYLHCVQCESRSPTLAAAYLARHLHISGIEALTRLKATTGKTPLNRTLRKAVERIPSSA